MKLTNPRRSTSFYETFSDLIFATMAIFVLVIIVLLLQVRPEGVPTKEYEKIIEDYQEQLEAKNEELEDLNEKLEDVVETSPLELIVIVDGSGSMKAVLVELHRAINTIAEAMPLIASKFSLGMIVYRSNLEVFPVKHILPAHEDNGNSFEIVKRWTNQHFEIVGGVANIGTAIDRALKMYSSDQSRKALLVLGDVGPYESPSRTPGYAQVNCNQPSVDNSLIYKANDFSENIKDFRIFTLFTSNDPKIACYKESKFFFQRLASVTGEGGYTDDKSKILLFLLQGVLGVNT